MGVSANESPADRSPPGRERRTALGDPPTLNIDGFDRTCMSCHRMFPAREVAPNRMLQHRDIVLNHGINRRCYNCHDGVDRNPPCEKVCPVEATWRLRGGGSARRDLARNGR